MATLGQQVAERRKQQAIRDRKNYGQYGSGFKAIRDKLAAEDKFLNRLGGFSVDRGPRGNEFRYPGEDNQDLRYDAGYNIETSAPFGVFPQALSRGLPSAGYQKYMGMMGDPDEEEKQKLIKQALEMQPEFSAYPLTTSDVGDIAFRTGDTGMYSTDDIEPYYGQPTEGTMGRASPLVQELTGTGDIPLYDIRRPEDIAYGYESALPKGAQMTKPRQYIPNTMGADRAPSAMYKSFPFQSGENQGLSMFSRLKEALKDEFGGSAMAGELQSDLNATTGYGQGAGSSLENLSEEQQAELFNSIGIDPNISNVPTSGGGINLDAVDNTFGIQPPTYPSKWNPFTWFGYNRGGIASLRR